MQNKFKNRYLAHNYSHVALEQKVDNVLHGPPPWDIGAEGQVLLRIIGRK